MQLKTKCPKGHEIAHGIVCGGSTPYYNHGNPDADAPNVYFLMELATSELIRELHSELPFTLTDQDWEEMHDHCEGGCCSEPQCPECLEYLD